MIKGTMKIVGILLLIFAAVDFAGQYFNYDLTGVSWSAIVAGVIGSLLYSKGGGDDDYDYDDDD